MKRVIVQCVVSLLFLAMQRTQSTIVKCETRRQGLEPSLAPYVLGFRATKGTESHLTTGKTRRKKQFKRWIFVRADGKNVEQQNITSLLCVKPRPFFVSLPAAQHNPKNRNGSQNTSGSLKPCHNVWHSFATRNSHRWGVMFPSKRGQANALKGYSNILPTALETRPVLYSG